MSEEEFPKKWEGQGEHRKAYWRYGVKVVHRGIQLRSMLEREFVEHMEKNKGLELGVTLIYEPKHMRVTWFDAEGKKHSYTPDFYDSVNKVVYELKHSAAVKRDEVMINAKNAAAIEQFAPQDILFEFWTERTVKKAMKEKKL